MAQPPSPAIPGGGNGGAPTAVARRDGLPDPRRFDAVRFPGQADGEVWPPTHFDFQVPWLRRQDLQFERDPGGGMCVVRRFEHLRLVTDLENAHRLLDIEAGTRDFRLLRLIPAALRFREAVAPGDPVPGLLRNEDPPPADDHHIYAASTALVEALGGTAGDEGLALCEAIRRVPPGRAMFEQAVARCVAQGGYDLARVAGLARRLQRLANAHAQVLAAAAAQPDYQAMERMIQACHGALSSDRRWAGDLLSHALAAVVGAMERPRRTVTQLVARATEALRRPGVLQDLTRTIAHQREVQEHLLDLATFWQRLAAAWLAVHPETTDRREIEALARNALRRLSLTQLYRVD